MSMIFLNNKGEEVSVSEEYIRELYISGGKLSDVGLFSKIDLEEAPEVLINEEGAWNWEDNTKKNKN